MDAADGGQPYGWTRHQTEASRKIRSSGKAGTKGQSSEGQYWQCCLTTSTALIGVELGAGAGAGGAPAALTTTMVYREGFSRQVAAQGSASCIGAGEPADTSPTDSHGAATVDSLLGQPWLPWRASPAARTATPHTIEVMPESSVIYGNVRRRVQSHTPSARPPCLRCRRHGQIGRLTVSLSEQKA
jgi:hypothetical protein